MMGGGGKARGGGRRVGAGVQAGAAAQLGGVVAEFDPRSLPAHAMLRAQFGARTVEKGYLALVKGELHAGGEIRLGV